MQLVTYTRRDGMIARVNGTLEISAFECGGVEISVGAGSVNHEPEGDYELPTEFWNSNTRFFVVAGNWPC